MEPIEPRPWLRHYPEEVPPSASYPDWSVPDLLLEAARKHGDRPAVHFLGRTITYNRLLEDVRKMAGILRGFGVAKGERVAIMLPNCPQAVIAYYGALLAGAVVVQTNPLYVERELEHQLADSGASVIITVDLLYARLARVRGEHPELGPLPDLRKVIITSIKDGLPFPKNILYPLKQRKEGFRPDIPYGKHGIHAYSRLMAAAKPDLASVAGIDAANDLAQLQYTGGTTGLAKGVMLTHRNLVANTMQTSAWFYRATDTRERFLAALPLFHVFGLTVLMNLATLRAGELILLPRFETVQVLQTIREKRPSIFPGAPTMYVALINHPQASKMDLSSIEICVSGSAPLPLEVQEKFESLTGGRLIEGYGLTEASPVTHANPIWGKRKIGTIGLPFPDTDCLVVDPKTGEPVAIGEIGELAIRGPQVMKGYWNRPDETAKVLRDGWLYTGDLATMDEDGFFAIVDRIKDVIIAGGFNIYPREVEEVLYEHPGVQEAAIIGIEDEYRGQTVKAYIIPKQGAELTQAELNHWCRARLASFKVPHLYEFRDSLPKTIIGKVLKRKLHEELENDPNPEGSDKDGAE
ncbi:long-chain-fatty-acid--CoA ligase [Paenibacillus sp. MMS18-CY102]|uniref:long-chain-fatty-acid--CoA ligase n=1 Tax=Paenibacillus sp. MMS18-CY102 TaxID=2682849 RepID=UPI0013657A3F|nr:long-chain fatty acid--CoA ligase [Paenibacillus sp. MMS18-CY102]MWC29995.1 AMP-binding protein [Paenibacillus sp. MMS18-CY102]